MHEPPMDVFAIAYWHGHLPHAVGLLETVPIEKRRSLKVNSGEPLAAILLRVHARLVRAL